MRYSYVIWQEEVSPFIVVELLLDRTEKEDLGKTLQDKQPPKWEVYEQWLQVPYYVLFSRKDLKKYKVYRLTKGRYCEVTPQDKRIWLPEIKIGLGVWTGNYQGIKHQWLRWYDADGKWIPTQQERAEVATRRANTAEAELARFKALLAKKGLSVDDE